MQCTLAFIRLSIWSEKRTNKLHRFTYIYNMATTNKGEQPGARKKAKPKKKAKARVTKKKKRQTPQQRTVAGKKRMLKALELSYGIVTDACLSAKVGRTQHYKWYNEDRIYQAACDDCYEGAIDHVEGKLMARINGYEHDDVHISTFEGHVIITPIIKHYPPDTPAMALFLKAKGKKRGYFDKVEKDVRFPDGGTIPLTLNIK